MDDEFGDSGADVSFDTGDDSSAEDTAVDQASDSSDTSWGSNDSVDEDMAEAIPEDPSSECETEDGDCVGSDESPDAIEELPSDDDLGPDDGANSGEDGGVDLNEDELKDEVPGEYSNEGESGEESSESLLIDEAEQQSEVEDQAAAAETEQTAEADAPARDSQELTLDDVEVTVPEGMDPIDLKGPDLSECTETIGHQDLADIELNRELEVGDRVKDQMDADTCAENALDAVGNQVEDASRPSVDALNKDADKAVEMAVADGHKADYTEDYGRLDSSQEDSSAPHDLRDILRKASDEGAAEGGAIADSGDGMDDNSRPDQMDAVVYSSWLAQQKMER